MAHWPTWTRHLVPRAIRWVTGPLVSETGFFYVVGSISMLVPAPCQSSKRRDTEQCQDMLTLT